MRFEQFFSPANRLLLAGQR